MTRLADLPPDTPGLFSVYRFCTVIEDGFTGLRTLTEWAPFSYEDRPDNTLYTVQDGDTLFTIAAQAYAPLGSTVAPRLAKVIAVYQPAPIFDLSIAVERGTVLYLPSLDMVETEIFGVGRRADYEA